MNISYFKGGKKYKVVNRADLMLPDVESMFIYFNFDDVDLVDRNHLVKGKKYWKGSLRLRRHFPSLSGWRTVGQGDQFVKRLDNFVISYVFTYPVLERTFYGLVGFQFRFERFFLFILIWQCAVEIRTTEN